MDPKQHESLMKTQNGVYKEKKGLYDMDPAATIRYQRQHQKDSMEISDADDRISTSRFRTLAWTSHLLQLLKRADCRLHE
jgi:hypothetical protein